MRKFTFTIVPLIFASVGWAHFDIRPRVESSKIVTDGFDDGTSDLLSNVRVFGYDFGENVDDPFFAQDPGFNAASGSGLPVGSQFKFNLLGDLQFWDGSGEVAFADVSSGESLDLNFGASTRTLTGSSGAQAGFNIQTVGAGGTVHRHLNAFLNGPDGNTLPAGPGSWGAGDSIQAADGIYMFSMQLLLDPNGGIASSDPIFIVFNNGLDEEVHDSAIEWVNTNLVPEPMGASLVGLLGMLLVRRR